MSLDALCQESYSHLCFDGHVGESYVEKTAKLCLNQSALSCLSKTPRLYKGPLNLNSSIYET